MGCTRDGAPSRPFGDDRALDFRHRASTPLMPGRRGEALLSLMTYVKSCDYPLD